jgi:hypothetical protein
VAEKWRIHRRDATFRGGLPVLIALCLLAGFAALAGLSSAAAVLLLGLGSIGLAVSLGCGVVALGAGLWASVLAFAIEAA